MWVDFDVKGQQDIDFSLEEVGLWTFKVKIMYLFLINILVHKVLIDGLEWCGLLVHYCDHY